MKNTIEDASVENTNENLNLNEFEVAKLVEVIKDCSDETRNEIASKLENI